MLPRIMMVAVPWFQHSWRLGHFASSHTVCNPFFLKVLCVSAYSLSVWIGRRIHSGMRAGLTASVASLIFIFSRFPPKTPVK
jgi:hypothetical protein